MKDIISNILNKNYNLNKYSNGLFEYEIYADYNDRLDNEVTLKILESKNPMDTLYDYMEEIYKDYILEVENEIIQDVGNSLTSECLEELLYFKYPIEHYLQQKFNVNIMLDTGDGNYDYTLNCVYPSYCGRYKEKIDDKASIIWLTKQQGYSKTQLYKVLYNKDESLTKGFLTTLKEEIENISTPMQVLTFLTQMTLEDLINVNKFICGYLILDSKTTTGLYDPWNGGGSLFNIQLEKDVRIPIKFIRSALPDGGDGYSIKEVYGCDDSMWKSGTVKKIYNP